MADHTPHEHHHQHTEPVDYQTWITDQREGKDDYFRNAPGSPIPEPERAAFVGLSYYPVTEAMRFEFLELGPLTDGLELETEVQTSDGAIRHGKRVGTFDFTIDGAPQQLVALRLAGADDDSAFVPFKDATNGLESYGAGRYLDLAQQDGTYDLDFNLAYAPFCAYSPSYSCPLPPRENWLSVRIEAGERNR